MARGGRQVLHQTASQMHVQDLHPAANREQRKVASQRFVDEGPFHGVAIGIGRFGFRAGGFAVERGSTSLPPVSKSPPQEPIVSPGRASASSGSAPAASIARA